MTTRKHKPSAAANKKRPSSDRKTVKAAPASKKAAVARDKERGKTASAPKKVPAAQSQPAHAAHAKAAGAKTSIDGKQHAVPVIDGKNTAKTAGADKKPLGLE